MSMIIERSFFEVTVYFYYQFCSIAHVASLKVIRKREEGRLRHGARNVMKISQKLRGRKDSIKWRNLVARFQKGREKTESKPAYRA